MNRGLIARTLCGSFLAWAWLGCARAPAIEDYVAHPSPNLFLPVTLEKPGKGEVMRRPFHIMRTNWDDYFKVWPKPREDHQATTLAKLRASPRSFLHRKVEFDIFMYEHGSFFRPFVAHFHSDTHFNFGAWTHGADIWNKPQRKDVFPFLYIDLRDDKIIRKVEAIPMYAGVHLWGTVDVVSEGYPWITVTDVEVLKEPRLTEASLRDLELAFIRVEKKDWVLATTALRAALNEQLPLAARFKVQEALAKCLMEQGLYASARETLIEGLQLYGGPRIQLVDALRRDIGCTRFLVLLAQTDLKLELNEEARTAGELAVRFEPSNPLPHVLAGLALAKLGDIREGLKEVDVGQRLAPEGKYLEARRCRAQIFALQGNWEGAKAEVDQALLLRPNDPSLHLELGDVLMAQKNYAQAQKEYDLVSTSLAPDRAEPYVKQAQAFRALGDAALAANKKDEAAGFYAQALEKVKAGHQKEDLYAPAYAFHAELLRAVDKKAEAAAVLEQADQAGAKSFALQQMLYEQARAQGDWEKMERASMRMVLLRSEDASLHARLADVRTYRPAPDYAGAESEYVVVTNLEPGNVNAWSKLAFVRNRLAMWAPAATAAQQAVALDSGNYSGWTELAIARRQLGERDGAVAAAEQAFALQNTVASRINLATSYMDRDGKGDAAVALPLAKLAASEAQTEAEKAAAQSVLGAALLQANGLKEALGALRAADAVLGEDAWQNLWAGRALLRSGDAAGAKARFEKATRLAGAKSSPLMERIYKEAEKGLKEAEKAKPAPAPKAEAPEKPAEKAAKANTPPVIQAEPNSGPVPVTAEPNPGTH
jgi:Flp pilus assembly protein TadD